MIYIDRPHNEELWWDLYKQHRKSRFDPYVIIPDAGINSLLEPTVVRCDRRSVDKFRYALAADYIEENWDRLLAIAETATGVDPEPLLRRLLERLRTEWADYQNGVGK